MRMILESPFPHITSTSASINRWTTRALIGASMPRDGFAYHCVMTT